MTTQDFAIVLGQRSLAVLLALYRARPSAFSISLRIACGLVIVSGSFCFSIHASSASSASGCMRTTIGVPFPVAGGPRFFFGITV